MKKCISIFFVLVILVSQYGHYCLYAFQEMRLRKEFKAKIISSLPDSSLEKIIDNGDIIWKEEGKEFFLHGELYDIVKTSSSGGKKCYYVINDHLEKKLVGDFNRFLKKHDNQSKRGRMTLKFSPAIFTIVAESSLINLPEPQKRTYFIHGEGILSLPKSLIPRPPRLPVV